MGGFDVLHNTRHNAAGITPYNRVAERLCVSAAQMDCCLTLADFSDLLSDLSEWLEAWEDSDRDVEVGGAEADEGTNALRTPERRRTNSPAYSLSSLDRSCPLGRTCHCQGVSSSSCPRSRSSSKTGSRISARSPYVSAIP